MNRNPPLPVARTLRQEIGFGCPIPAPKTGQPCGNPYLQYHHFDPEWAVEQHHRPEGMIALCSEHHAKAGGGAFSVEYLRNLKAQAATNGVKGRFDWLLNDYLVVMGGAYGANVVHPIAYGDRPIVSFLRDPSGMLLMNLDMPTASVGPRLRMWESNWYEQGEPEDIECPPNGRLLKVRYKNRDYLRIEFRSLSSPEEFARRYPKVNNIGPLQFAYPATAIEIELRLTEAELHINKDVFRIGDNKLEETLHRGGQWFIGIGSYEPIERLSDHLGYSRKQFLPRLRLASENSKELLPVDDVQFNRHLGIQLDGYSYTNCSFTDCRLYFSGRPFSLRGCRFDGSAIVLTEQALSTCVALGKLQPLLNLDIVGVLANLAEGF